jgi:GNAT superfamily N-acetyltransferase
VATSIQVEARLSDKQEAAILALGDIWESEHLGLTWRAKDHHIMRYVGGEFAAKASVLKHSVVINDNEVLVGGVGGVITMPAFQGQGHATAVLSYLADYLGDQLRLPFGMLFCRPALVPFYGRFRWQIIADTVYVDQPNGVIASPLPVMYASYSNQPWPKGSVQLNSEPW